MNVRLARILPVLFVSLFLAGCQAIADIFQAGIWVGVILVVAVVAIIGFIASRFSGGRR
jgi:hypothetical protein